MSEIDVAPWSNFQWWRRTYTFQEIEYTGSAPHVRDCFYGVGDKGEQLSIKGSDCIVHELFPPPKDGPFDEHIRTYHTFLNLYFTYFREVFNLDSDGAISQFNFERIILPKSLFNEISDFVDKNKLTPYKDLILLIIAKAQDLITGPKYLYSYYEKRKNTVQNIKKNTESLIKLIDTVLPEFKNHETGPAQTSPLQNIQFKFLNSEYDIEISDTNFGKELVRTFRERYEEGYLKNWRKQLKAYSSTLILEHEEAANFKYLYAKALYNFFTQNNIARKDKKPFPNDLMKCIYQIIEYSLIHVGSMDDIPGDKIKTIRNWIKDHSIKERKPFETIKADTRKLCKYFEKDFINSVTDVKGMESITLAIFITERFELQHIFKELVHIISCFNVMHHFYYNPSISHDNNKFPADFVSFQEISKKIQDKKKISKLSLTIDGQECALSERLPLYIIEQALNDYFTESEYEFSKDMLEGQVKYLPDKQQAQANFTGKLNKPENRFVVKFVSSFYSFLSNESRYSNKEMIQRDIDNAYYTLIGLVLEHTWFFMHKRHSEPYLLNKVRNWHKLSQLHAGQ